jgi:hypothetical protein
MKLFMFHFREGDFVRKMLMLGFAVASIVCISALVVVMCAWFTDTPRMYIDQATPVGCIAFLFGMGCFQATAGRIRINR